MVTARMLGRLVLEGDGGALSADELGGPRPRRLLEVLLLSPGRVVQRDRLAELLWDGEPPVGHASRLASQVCTLRHHLARIGAGGITLVDTAADGYLVPRAAVHRDLDDLERLAVEVGRGTADPGEAAALVAALRGGLLEDEPDATWLDGPRDTVRRQLVEVVLHVCERALVAGELLAALRGAELAVRLDPSSERACLTHAGVLLSRGNRAMAATVIDRYQRLLHGGASRPPTVGALDLRRLTVAAG